MQFHNFCLREAQDMNKKSKPDEVKDKSAKNSKAENTPDKPD